MPRVIESPSGMIRSPPAQSRSAASIRLLSEAIGDIVLRRRLDIVAERRLQVGIVVQIVIGAEAVAIAALARAVDDVVRAAGVAVGAEGIDRSP